jgi:hypothetical protein
MREAGLNVPEIRHEQGVLTEVRFAEPRPPAMFVQVDVNHGDGLHVGHLQRLAEARAAYRCSRGRIVDVVFILDVMDSPGEQEQRGSR